MQQPGTSTLMKKYLVCSFYVSLLLISLHKTDDSDEIRCCKSVFHKFNN